VCESAFACVCVCSQCVCVRESDRECVRGCVFTDMPVTLSNMCMYMSI